MKLAQTNLNAKIIVAGIIAAVLIVGLSGCGKSEATKAAEQAAAQQVAERHDARQNFKGAVAAMKVHTESSTYPEFRQAELDLRTSYEVNKTYLDDVRDQFANLDALMTATDYLWSYSLTYRAPLDPKDKVNMRAIIVITPDTQFTNKSNYSFNQIEDDPDFWARNYVPKGLTKISAQTDLVLNLLAK